LRAGTGLGAGSLLRLAVHAEAAAALDDRTYWTTLATKVAEPVLSALCARKLRERMPVEVPNGNVEERRRFAHLEALGRLLTGIAPWIEACNGHDRERKECARIAAMARESLDAATDPRSPDFMNFQSGMQPVVDTAFLALAIVRAPQQLWRNLDKRVQGNVVAALQSSRAILPYHNNWLLFSAIIEAALSTMGVRWDAMRVDYALRMHDNWYQGDGFYGDGPEFHCDYYNSFVIHPMMLNILDVLGSTNSEWHAIHLRALERSRRYAVILERMIAPDGSFPPVGRSLCYRFGVFHLLAEIALRRLLPQSVAPEQVRAGLTAVMRRMAETPGTFDQNGWLRIGFCGYQPELAEDYISTGSSYLCSAAWLPLGLAPTDRFWANSTAEWSAQKAWSGRPIAADRAL